MILKRVLIGAGGVALVGMFALLALFGGAGVANAQTDPTTPTTPQATQTPKPAPAVGDVIGYSGTITAVTGSNFTLETRGGTLVEVTTNSSTTWFVIESNGVRAQGSLADLAVGDEVTVAGIYSGTNAVEARMVTEGRVGFGGRGGRGGHGGFGGKIGQLQATVTAINGSTLTVTGPNGNASFTINTDANTLFVKGGFTTLSSIAVGDQVYVVPRMGSRTDPTTTSAATWTAAAIVSVADGNSVTLGRVESVSGNTITLNARRGTATTVTVGASTGYKQYSSDTQAFGDSSLSAVVAGSNVLVYGTTAADGSVSASAVVLLPEGGRGPRFDNGFPGRGGDQVLPENGTRQRGPIIGNGFGF